jgi:hypothetical protein
MMKHLVITWQGSKRASSSIAEKPSKKSRKNTIDLTEIDKQVSSYSSVYLLPYLCIWLSNFNVCFRQNIDADLGRVIAKVSSQINPSTSMKVAEKKKEKKKDKRTSQEEPSEQKDNSTQATPVEVLNVEKPKDKKKKKKLKKANSASTTTILDAPVLDEQLGNPQGANIDKLQDPPKEKISEQNNESSNSCLRPPSVKVSSHISFLHAGYFT